MGGWVGVVTALSRMVIDRKLAGWLGKCEA